MAPTTAQELYNCCFEDIMPSLPVITDFFGDTPEEHLYIVFGVYQGLVKRKGISVELLFHCYLSDRLTELVHAMYKHEKTHYYNMFCELNINLKDQCPSFILPTEHWKDIPNDDYCPNCNHKGFITSNFRFNRDCRRCYKLVCSHCVYNEEEDSENEGELICKKCISN